jgi:hypothetical protein
MSVAKNGYRRQNVGRVLVMICQPVSERLIKPCTRRQFNKFAPLISGQVERQIPEGFNIEKKSISLEGKINISGVKCRGFINWSPEGGEAWVEAEIV